MIRAGVYTRISKDKDGNSESPERQESIARALCASKGWDVVEVFTDLDLSAYQRGVHRPGYESMLDAARSGRIDAIVVWSVTRLARTVREFSRLMDELETLGVSLTSARDPIDTSTATGRAMAQIHGVFAELESATISSRVRDAQDYARRAGRMWTGGSRPFGWTGDQHEPAEAPIVREVAERLLRGETRAAVAADLNRRGVTTAAGNRWSGMTLWQMISAPRHAGYRVYGGEVFEGTWEPILDRPTHHRLLGLAGTARGRRTDGLLTGIAVCGLCFQNMHRRKVNGVPTYACRKQEGWDGCGRVSVRGMKLEEHVATSVLEFLAAASLRPAAERGGDLDALRAEVAEDEAALVRLANDHYVRRAIGAPEFESARAALAARIEQTRATIEEGEDVVDEASRLPAGDLPALREWWSASELEERRALVRRAVRQLVVHPVGKGGSAWRPERIELRWNYGLFLDAAAGVEPDEAEYDRLRAESERE